MAFLTGGLLVSGAPRTLGVVLPVYVHSLAKNPREVFVDLLMRQLN